MVMNIASPYSQPVYQPKILLEDQEKDTFYTDKINGLAITDKETLAALQQEVPDLEDYFGMNADDIDSIAANLTKGKKKKDGALTEDTHKLTHRSIMRLKGLCELLSYLSCVRRNATSNEMHWPTILTFLTEMKALKTLCEAEPPVVPKFSQAVGMAKHMQSLSGVLYRTYGASNCPLYYMICPPDVRDDSSPADAANCITGRCYQHPYSRLVDELIARLPRNSAAAHADNELLYSKIAESLSGTSAESYLEHHERTRDGVALWKRLHETQCTSDAHETIAKKHLQWLLNAAWRGPQDGKLVDHIEKFRRQFQLYHESAKLAKLQEYTERSMVDYLILSLKSTDPMLLIRLNSIKDDENYRSDFEQAAIYLAKTNYEGKTMSRKRARDIQEEAKAASVQQQGGGLKTDDYQEKLDFSGSRGKSGVELRWHTPKEYNKLNLDQRKELTLWRATNPSVLNTPKKKTSPKKQQKIGVKGLKKAFGKVASLLGSLDLPEDKKKSLEAIVESVGVADVSSVMVDHQSTGEEDHSNQQDPQALEVGEVKVTPESEPDAQEDDTSSGNADEMREKRIVRFEKEVIHQAEAAAALGLTEIKKICAKKRGEE